MSLWRSEAIAIHCFRLCAVLSAAIAALIILFLLRESLPLIQQIGFIRFWLDKGWQPTSQEFNLAPMFLGSVYVALGAVALATPLGILSAIFCRYYAPPLISKAYRHLLEILSGIPSVIYGFWGLVVLAPLIGQFHPPGPSLLTGILVLAMMILPTIALVAEVSFASVPADYLHGAAALGLGQWATIQGIAIPAAKTGLIAGMLLAIGRAIGETMAVLMVCGNVVQVPDHLFAPVRTLTANIALEMAYATGDHRSALFVSGLVLMLLVALLAAIATQVRGRLIYD